MLASSSLLHQTPITLFCIILSNDKEGSHTIATSSHDLTTQLCQFTIHPRSMDLDTTPSTSIIPASLHLYTIPVSFVSSSLTGTHLLTLSWDGLMGLWDTSIPFSNEVPEPVSNKHLTRVSKVLVTPTGNIITDNNGGKEII